ncbi:hypothetical protein ACUIAJ_03925 [Dermabacteraceae bacterium CCM 9519]
MYPEIPNEEIEAAAAHVSAHKSERAEVIEKYAAAGDLLARRGGTNPAIPESVQREARMSVFRNLWEKRSSNAQSMAVHGEMLASPRRPALDPMAQAWPLITPYIGGTVA